MFWGTTFCFKCWRTQVTTSDSGIKIIFEQECVSCPNDQSPILTRLENILELGYGVFNIIVLLCNWVKKNYNGNNTIINWNEYGFTFIQFASFIVISNHSFVSHYMYFYKKKGWKVVLWKDPCGKRVNNKNQIDHTNFDFFKAEMLMNS